MKRNAPMSEHEMWRHTGPRWHLVQDYKEQTDA
jgi:hypothetical protein